MVGYIQLSSVGWVSTKFTLGGIIPLSDTQDIYSMLCFKKLIAI